jgi:tetratricopeptide (TPR) repeat protein
LVEALGRWDWKAYSAQAQIDLAPTPVGGMIQSKRFLLVSILVLLCHSAAFSQSRQAQVDSISSALRTRDFDRAVELSGTVLQQFPHDVQIWTLRGIAFAGEGDGAKALAAFQQALKISPNHIPALQGAAQIEFQTGNREAAPLLNRLLQLRPGDPTAHAMLAVLNYREGKCSAAAVHFEKAGEILDSQLDALHAYATCLVRLKKIEAAATVFQRAAALHPNDPQELHALAAVQLMARKPQDVIVTLGPVLRSNPDAETLELASAAYEDSGDTPQAVESLRRAILLDPRNVDLYLDFAHISYAHESFQVGADVVGEGIAQQPAAAPLYLARGVLYVQLGEFDKAETDFAKAHELDPKQSLSAAAQGMAAVQANDLNRALSTVQAKLARSPNDALLLYLQADILSQQGAAPGSPEFQTAMHSAKKAVSLQPTLASARSVLAKLYLQAGQNQQAVEQCRKALERDPKDQTSLYRLIQALRKTGNQAEIPDLLKRLALLREQTAKEDRERYRYKLIEGDAQPNPPALP